MNATTRKPNPLRNAAFVLLAAIGLASVAPAVQAADALVVSSVKVSGSLVTVGVTNTSALSTSGYVYVKSVVSGTAIWSVVPVYVAAGKTASASLTVLGTVCSVSTSGATVQLTDDPSPF